MNKRSLLITIMIAMPLVMTGCSEKTSSTGEQNIEETIVDSINNKTKNKYINDRKTMYIEAYQLDEEYPDVTVKGFEDFRLGPIENVQKLFGEDKIVKSPVLYTEDYVLESQLGMIDESNYTTEEMRPIQFSRCFEDVENHIGGIELSMERDFDWSFSEVEDMQEEYLKKGLEIDEDQADAIGFIRNARKEFMPQVEYLLNKMLDKETTKEFMDMFNEGIEGAIKKIENGEEEYEGRLPEFNLSEDVSICFWIDSDSAYFSVEDSTDYTKE